MAKITDWHQQEDDTPKPRNKRIQHYKPKMSEKLFIIGDIAGELDALTRLLKHCQPGRKIVCVGDIVDRGPDSKGVIELLMARTDITVLKGNHEDMMVDWWEQGERYQTGVWLRNGGLQTLHSYDERRPAAIPATHITWMRNLPTYYQSKGITVTHAPINPRLTLDEANNPSQLPFDELGILWCRQEPVRRDYFQVFGHNAHWGLRQFRDDSGPYAMCIDTSHSQHLTGLLWPELTAVSVPYAEDNK